MRKKRSSRVYANPQSCSHEEDKKKTCGTRLARRKATLLRNLSSLHRKTWKSRSNSRFCNYSRAIGKLAAKFGVRRATRSKARNKGATKNFTGVGKLSCSQLLVHQTDLFPSVHQLSIPPSQSEMALRHYLPATDRKDGKMNVYENTSTP